jgi:outer membrane protein TolC
MTRNGSTRTATAAFALAGLIGLAAPAHAQQISDARIRELIKEATDPANRLQTPATVQPGATGDNRPTVPLTLDDAVRFALDRNLDIAVQRLNPEINDILYASTKSVYHPSLTSVVSTQSTTNPATSTLSGSQNAAAPVVAGVTNFNGGIAQSIPWGGGSAAVQLNNNKQTTTSLNVLYNPTYNTNWSGSYTQPLLRNFSTDATRRTLQVTKINRDISDVQLRSTITNTVSNVRNAYWDYVFSVQAVDVARQSLELAERLVRDNQTRVEVGTMAPIDVIQAQSQSATARQNLVAAQSTMRTAELVLKRLIVGGTNDPNWAVRLDPVDRPNFAPQTFDIEAAVRRALSERTDIAIAKKNLEVNDVTLKFLVDQMRPQADFVATYGLVGVGGAQYVYPEGSTGVNRQPVGTLPGGYANALSTLFGTNYPRWTAQINFSYPLGTSAQEANVARARVQQNQVQAQMKQIELQVATEVTNAVTTATSNSERVQAAQAARDLAQKQLEAEQSKFEVGMSTNFNVIQAQRDLATAQNNELQAILNYRKSLVEVERLQQTTLQNLNITLVTAGGGVNLANGAGQ